MATADTSSLSFYFYFYFCQKYLSVEAEESKEGRGVVGLKQLVLELVDEGQAPLEGVLIYDKNQIILRLSLEFSLCFKEEKKAININKMK